jgi:hypothetical protein
MADDVGDVPLGADRPALPLGAVDRGHQVVPGRQFGVAVPPRGGAVGAGDLPRGYRCRGHFFFPL